MFIDGGKEIVYGLTSKNVSGPIVYDLKLLYEGATLENLAQRYLSADDLFSFQNDRRRIKAIVHAAKVARMDLADVPASSLIPGDLFERHDETIHGVSRMAWERVIQRGPEALRRYEEETLPFARALLRMTMNGVKIDQEACLGLLRDEASLAVGKHVLRSMLDLSKAEGLARTWYTPFGGKTGRIRVEAGLDTMTIPHGRCRSCIKSRFDGGKIYALDFNAIDYRSIVAAVPELQGLYSGCEDFHTRTREILLRSDFNHTKMQEILPEIDRQQLKHLTYVHLYGGSLQTAMEKTRLPSEKISEVLKVMDFELDDITKFRDKLHREGVENGCVVMPNERLIRVESDDHPGKVLGLFAQSYSSWIFERALVTVDRYIEEHRKTHGHRLVTLFPVHDELVIDAPAEEEAIVAWCGDVMEDATGFKVKVKMGSNYSEATD